VAKVELVHISKTYNEKDYVIEDLSVSIEQGEFFALVGPSGCGKSTILRMIAGLESITSGELFIDGKKANELPPSERNLSMVFQNYALYPHLTVEQNILFGLHTKKISKQEQKKRCYEAAEMLGLIGFLNYKPRQLSGGQRQRVALARAIVTCAPICLMDEPLSNLDAKLRAKMRSEIRQIQRRLGITMIYVTHDQIEAMTMADRMMILHRGRVQQIGQPLDIYNHPANTFVASFIGAPPVNLAEGRGLEKSVLFNSERVRHILSSSSPKMVVGVRPEHVRPASTNQDHFLANVVNVEMLGTETLVTFELTKDEHWIARWNGQWNVRAGELIPLAIDEKDFIFFHENGQRLNRLVSPNAVNRGDVNEYVTSG